MSGLARDTAAFIREIYGDEQVLLHRPVFAGNEKAYLAACVDSNFVSSVGARVADFERQIAAFTGARHAVAVVNGTAALHAALQLCGAGPGTEVITQALTFVASCNAAAYTGAAPVFVDVDATSLGMCPRALAGWLQANVRREQGRAVNRHTGRPVVACVPMHTFGHPCAVDEIAALCSDYGIALVEDAAEALGSWRHGRHAGTTGRFGAFSFNGNKIITTGGGGMVVTDDEELAVRCKHLTTTAKVAHPYEYDHDELGYNYRLPNLNAALGCAQMEQLPGFVRHKRELAQRYAAFFADRPGVRFVQEPAGCASNYWLNAIVLESPAQRTPFLEQTNAAGVMTRPVWRLMTELPMYRECQHDGLPNARALQERVVNLPSSVPLAWLETH